MSFLEIAYEKDAEFTKEIRIISLEQVCGAHIKFNNDIREELKQCTLEHPEKYSIKYEKQKFRVIGPNSADITHPTYGKASPWFLIKALKDPRKTVYFLMLGQMLWGIESASGLRMKKTVEKYGQEKVSTFFEDQINSLLQPDASWKKIEVHFR